MPQSMFVLIAQKTIFKVCLSLFLLVLVGTSFNQLLAQCGFNQYTVSGGGNLCNGTRSVTITLVPGNQKDITYILKKDGNTSGYPSLVGTGSGLLSWTITSGVGTYTVVATNGTCNQQMSLSAVVTNQQTPTASISATGTGCSTTLTGSSGVSYAWRFNSSTGSVIATTQAYQPKKGGTYYFTVTNECGNSNQTSYNVTSIPKISIVPNGSITNTCPNILTLSASGGLNGSNYSWTKPDGSNVNASSLLIAVAGTYTLTGTNTCSIQETTSTPVTMLPVLTPPTALYTKASYNVSTLLDNTHVTGAQSGEIYKWYDNSGVFLSDNTYQTPNLITNTIYKVTKYSTTTCQSSPTLLTVIVNKVPTLSVNSPVNIVLPQTSGALIATGSDADGDPLSFTWSKQSGLDSYLIDNINTSTCNVSNLVAGTYVFKVTVSDGYDLATAYVTVNVNYPPNNYNWIKETTVRVKDKLTKSDVANLAIQDGSKNVSIKYIDGLGRLAQSVNMQASPSKKDIIEPVVYGAQGRVEKKYLPFVSGNDGYFKDDPTGIKTSYSSSLHSSFYHGMSDNITDDDRPFSETVFEGSQLDRPIKTYGPGQNWLDPANSIDKYVGNSYLVNKDGTSAGQEQIIVWTMNSSTGLPERDKRATLNSGSGFYPTGSLIVKSTINEEGNEVREYTNNEGQIILKKVYVSGSKTDLTDRNNWAQTYYVFDVLGNLRFVLAPELSKKICQNIVYNPSISDLNLLAFQYKYNSKKLICEKRLPGTKAIYMVYDSRGRLILSQTGNQRFTNTGSIKKEWIFTKYDIFNRPIITGLYIHPGNDTSQVEMQAYINGQFVNENQYYEDYYYNNSQAPNAYTNRGFPTLGTNTTIYTVSYYDSYKFRDDLIGAYNYVSNDFSDQETSEAKNVNGFLTGSFINKLNTSEYQWAISYFDSKGRVLQVQSKNHKGGIDRASNVYDFVSLKKNCTVHTNGSNNHTIKRRFDYDHVGRLSAIWHTFDTQAEILLSQNVYNEIGRLNTKNLHSIDNGSSFSQNVDYFYNIRGSLSKINDLDNLNNDLFGLSLSYENPVLTGSTKQFNGNVSETIWRTVGCDKQSYAYTYDALSRMLLASYANTNNPARNYSERIGDGTLTRPSYDLNGNIKNLIRYGKQSVSNQGASIFGKIDDLTYTYSNGDNRITKIEDFQSDTNFDDGFKENNVHQSSEYSYDPSGNIIMDQNKGLTIIYNYLNLPIQVTKNSTDYVTYTYDALGKKLTQKVFGSNAKTTEYIGEYVYENYGTSDVLQFVTHDEGRVIADLTPGAPRPWEYQYFIKDHLGSVRVTFSEKKTNVQYKATLEDAYKSDEQSWFKNYNQLGGLNEFDHTDAGNTFNKSLLLNAGNNSKIGLAKSFSVNPGDVIDFEVYAKYEEPSNTGTNVNDLLNSLIQAFSLGTSTTPTESQQALSAFNSLFPNGGPWIGNDKWDASAPKAYLNYILFDENFVLQDFGFDQISTSAKQSLSLPIVLVPHDYLNLHIKVQKKGYLYAYLSNENPYETRVYFDDYKINYNSSIQQVKDYYPFGYAIASTSYERPNYTKNPLGFGEKEIQDELNIGWYDYSTRMYDPTIARWIGVDPLAGKMRRWSPYNYCFNNPIRFIDSDGMWPEPPKWLSGFLDWLGLNPWSDPSGAGEASSQDHNRAAVRELTSRVRKLRDAQRDAFDVVPVVGPIVNSTIDGKSGERSSGEIAENLTFNAASEFLPIIGDAGKKVIGKILEGAFETNISKTIVSKVVGTVDDALAKFKSIIGDTEVTTITNKAGHEIKTATMSDGTTITYRAFSSSESNANAVIQLNNSKLQRQGAKPLEIKFFNEKQ
jgi:RHS repeat-associated protein